MSEKEAAEEAIIAQSMKHVRELSRLFDVVRERARTVGYAIGVHGSMRRDIDLIAVPWTAAAAHASFLAEEVRRAVEEVCGFAAVPSGIAEEMPRRKPHGRLCWLWATRLGDWWTQIDLSVMSLGDKE
jgi:hypothetical protein